MALPDSDQLQRVRHLAFAEKIVERCNRHHFVNDYLPGQVIYNLSEYPAPGSLKPTEYDHELLHTLAAGGVTLIQLHEEWHDILRRFGGDRFNSYDPAGLKEFIDVAHSVGIKVIPYISSGFCEGSDPDFRPDWVEYDYHYAEYYCDYVLCSPRSPGWRSYLLPRVERMLDEYGFDGLYNDVGYDRMVRMARERYSGPSLATVAEPDFVLPYDAAWEDLLGHLMTLTQERNGVMKVHVSWHLAPTTYSKVYDYLWVGELVTSFDRLRQLTQTHEPYVVPCPDYLKPGGPTEEQVYVNTVPFMQFPLRVDGRPVTGERVVADDVHYYNPPNDDNSWSLITHMKRVREHYLSHMDGPHTYGSWDPIGGGDEPRIRWLEQLALYSPMVEPNTTCWLDIRESGLFTQRSLGDDLVASLFVNDRAYLVLGNLSDQPAQVVTTSEWTDRQTQQTGRDWSLAPRSLTYLIDTLASA